MSRINSEWHKAHRMPANPTFDQRVNWHLEHVANCNCRGIPAKLAREMRANGVEIPEEKVEK